MKEKERNISCLNSLPEEEQVTYTGLLKERKTLNSSPSCVKKRDDEEGKIRRMMMMTVEAVKIITLCNDFTSFSLIPS